MYNLNLNYFFLNSYEACFIQGLLVKNEKKPAQSFNFTFRYIDGRLKTKIYDKRNDFNFPIVNSSFICSNIQATPSYGVYISQLIRYSRVCGPIRVSWIEDV
jgi:hypothetical protein